VIPVAGTWPPGPERPEVPPPRTPEPAPPPRPPVHRPDPLVYETAPGAGSLADRLLDRRTVLVSGPLDRTVATDAAARLMLLDGTGDDPVDLLMSCPDGDLVSAMSLADTVELVGVEVRALCTGSLGGPPILVFAVAPRRIAQPHATFRLTEPDLAIQGRAGDIAHEAERHAALLADFHSRLAAATGHRPESVAADLRARRLLTAPQAKAYGLVGEIARRLRAT
jgi:ATP-dependent Clp protease protease subunit